ncbi:HNH endonuclease signature motif containing protein [Sanguibacter suarezii]|uniref:HNH endonuclease signature motif containing protein n=1 Tax=Sanguibacter suarezii TaxID=60921 RepID=UPI000A40EC91|nr:HNH endonuclease signature motif containing protein [Sanguibacter suarezii]
MDSGNSFLTRDPAPVVERIEIAPWVWADVADGPVSTLVEDWVEVAFEELIRSAWPAGAGEMCAQAVPADDGLCVGPVTPAVVTDRPDLGAPVDVFAQLDQLEALVELIASTDPASLPGVVAQEVSRRIHGSLGRLEGQRLGCIGRAEAEGSWRAETMHSFASWLAKAEGLSETSAARTVAAARAVREHLPATGVAARAGVITSEHVAIMVKATKTPVLCQALAGPVPGDAEPEDGAPEAGVCTGEQALLAHTATWSVKDFNTLIKRFTVSADPETQEKAFKDAVEREYLRVSPTLGGMTINGFVTTEHGQLITTALRSIAGVPAADDLRPADLRKVDALVDLCQRALDGGIAGKGANVRPHLSVHVSWEEFTRVFEATHGAESDSDSTDADGTTSTTGVQSWSSKTLQARLRAGYATWEDGTGPIPDAVLRRIACDGEVTRIIFGPDSQILNIGRSRRTFTKEHRRAIVARDRTCVWPGCDAPPHVCEIHHAIRHWADNGDTTPSNGALLCRHHHHRVDGENIAMTYDDRWTVHMPGTYQPGAVAA